MTIFKEKKGAQENTPHTDDRSISTEFIRWAIGGIILLVILVHIGFSKTYIQFFPKFDGFKSAQHFMA